MAIDDATIASNLAAHFLALTPPTGYSAFRSFTHLPPQALTALPAGLVLPADEESGAANSNRKGTLDFRVRCYFAMSADIAAAAGEVYAWRPVLRASLDDYVHAGAAGDGVALAEYVGSEVLTVERNGQTYACLDVGVRVVYTYGIDPSN